MSERAAKLFAVRVNEATADGERAAAATAACAVYRGDGFVGLQKPGWSQIPNFHGSVDAAMALVAKAREWGWNCKMQTEWDTDWSCSSEKMIETPQGPYDYGREVGGSSSGPSLSAAICAAFLQLTPPNSEKLPSASEGIQSANP